MTSENIKEYLSSYNGEELNFMEICGTHTAAVYENGIPSLLSDKIHLISGPGCPVCVTVTDYIDRLCELSLKNNTAVVTFGDMLRVPGSTMSLADAKGAGGTVYMVYSPLDIIKLAKAHSKTTFVFAAVGFETTTPIYAVLIDTAIKEHIANIKLLTALKTMPAAIDALYSSGSKIDGFLAPGHVAAIIGSNAFKQAADKHQIPFVVSGFESEQLLMSIYALCKLKGCGVVKNMYTTVVKDTANYNAEQLVNKYFAPCDAAWRGLGIINNSGLALKALYSSFDAGSQSLTGDKATQNGCICTKVITGQKRPFECALYGKACTPQTPCGACMVSREGSCFNYYLNEINN